MSRATSQNLGGFSLARHLVTPKTRVSQNLGGFSPESHHVSRIGEKPIRRPSRPLNAPGENLTPNL